jgi:rRNA maturation RNase YbeY
MANITFFQEDSTYVLKNKIKIKDWLLRIAKKEGFTISELNYIFCSDEYLLNINKEYLDHNYYTDIITFDNSETKHQIEGDIFISIDRVKENAIENQVNTTEELHRVLAHGLLHLLGYKDKTIIETQTMRAKEDWALSIRKF